MFADQSCLRTDDFLYPQQVDSLISVLWSSISGSVGNYLELMFTNVPFSLDSLYRSIVESMQFRNISEQYINSNDS